MTRKSLAALAICAGVATLTLWAKNAYWLGGDNFFLLVAFLVAHIIVSSLVLWLVPGRMFFKTTIIAFLIVGQWWGIEFVAMLLLWSIYGFAP